MLLSKIKKTIKKYGMANAGDRILAGVSGGPDSVCLLSVLHALAGELKISLNVACLDHLFRGKESADEAAFVGELAKKLGLPAVIEQIDVPAFCRERGLSPQAGAREVRYAFFARVADSVGANRIATGHTADDQAETFLMRLLRGAGVEGLSAIPPVRGNIIRPLIEVTREEVMEYLKARGLEFRTDPSNLKSLYTRNRIRLEVLPLLRQFNPRVSEGLASEAALLRDEDEAAEACLAKSAAGVLAEDGGNVVLNRDEFNALPRAFRRRLFRKAADLAGVDASGLSMVQIDEAVAFLADGQTGRTMELPFGLLITREYGKFILARHGTAKGFSCPIVVPGATSVPGAGLLVETTIHEAPGAGEEDKNYLWQAQFDYDKMRAPLVLRSRMPGDRFCPAGMGGRSKKLQDYFVDEKVPLRKRDVTPLLISGGDILWVLGMRTDERYVAGPGTKRVLVIRVRNAECGMGS